MSHPKTSTSKLSVTAAVAGAARSYAGSSSTANATELDRWTCCGAGPNTIVGVISTIAVAAPGAIVTEPGSGVKSPAPPVVEYRTVSGPAVEPVRRSSSWPLASVWELTLLHAAPSLRVMAPPWSAATETETTGGGGGGAGAGGGGATVVVVVDASGAGATVVGEVDDVAARRTLAGSASVRTRAARGVSPPPPHAVAVAATTAAAANHLIPASCIVTPTRRATGLHRPGRSLNHMHLNGSRTFSESPQKGAQFFVNTHRFEHVGWPL